jgi:hypothetical protein
MSFANPLVSNLTISGDPPKLLGLPTRAAPHRVHKAVVRGIFQERLSGLKVDADD